jgi:TPR repeat protein
MAKIIVKAPFYKPGHKTEKGQSRGGYAQYIGTREDVEILRSGMAGYIGERRGSHGLFSDEGVDVSLSKISEEIDNHPGNVWGFIISLKREDAERVGYNSAEQWVNLLRSRRNVVAKEMGITPSNLRWVAAYHNKETNPHVHMMVWSSRPQEPYLSREGIHNIKKTLASDIFRQEHLQIYKKQTEARDDIKEHCRRRIAELCAQINGGNHAFSLELLAKMELLSEKLSKHKGKKVYGYLDKNTKALVKDIVKMLGADEQISAMYDAWHSYKCEIVRTYTDEVPDKIPIEDNEEFKSIRNAVIKSAAEISSPSAQPEREISYDYSELKERKNDFDYLSFHADFRDDPMIFYRLGRYYLEKTDDMENAEWWLRKAADRGLELASYLVYKGYRDGKFTEKPSDKLRYLRVAVDAGFGYAEYEYAKYLMDKSPEDAKIYFERAASHGSFQAEYTYGKMLFDEGKREEAREWFERSARTDAWTQTRVGLLFYYEYEDHESGKAFLSAAANQGYEPACEVLRSIEQGLNARIVIGVCDLFYYAGNILDERSEDMYSQEHQIDYHGIDKKQRRENQAKRQGIIMY